MKYRFKQVILRAMRTSNEDEILLEGEFAFVRTTDGDEYHGQVTDICKDDITMICHGEEETIPYGAIEKCAKINR